MLDINRINELYKKSKEVGLSEEEKEEQRVLRKAYIDSIRNNIISQLGDKENYVNKEDKKGE